MNPLQQQQQAQPSAATHWMCGKTLHIRHGAAFNRFIYPVLMLRHDLMQPLPCSWIFGYNRWGILSFYSKDHGNGQQRSNHDLRQWFLQQVQDAGLQLPFELARLELTTQPRVLGFVFNPISFWAAYDREHRLRLVLCEVNNTFGVRLSYLLHTEDFCKIESNQPLSSYKQLHVSPFFAVSGGYQFWFSGSGARQHYRIAHYNSNDDFAALLANAKAATPQSAKQCAEQRPDLDTTLTLYAQPFNPQSSLKQLLRYGFSTAFVVLRIHWQAIKLWRKGAIFHRSPPAPKQETHYESNR